MPHFPYPFVGAGWADYPTIFVEVGLWIPYSVEGFDQALQTNFKESVAKAFNVTSMRVKMVKITPNPPRDSSAWNGGYGSCSTYVPGAGNHNYCVGDGACPHCPVACELKCSNPGLIGANASFFVRVPSADEAKAQLMLAVTLEMVNMQLEQKGLNAALNFVGAARIVRQPCEAGKYRVRPGRVDVNCNSCPSSSSSPAGSVGIQACLCNAVSAT